MIENKPISKSRDTLYKVVIILIVAVASYSSAMKELNRLQEVAGSVHEFTSEGLGGLARVYAASMSVGESSKFNTGPEISLVDGVHWTALVATGGSMEVQGRNRNTNTEPTTKGDAEMLADNKAHWSGPNAEEAHVVEYSRNTTVSPIYPNTGANKLTTCELAKGNHLKSPARQVRFRTLVNAADAVGFVEGAVTGDLAKITLPGSVIANTLKRRIKIDARGDARERTVDGEVPAKPGHSNWPETFEFKKFTRALHLDLLSPTRREVELEIFDGGTSPDVQLTLPAKENSKHASEQSEMSSWR